MCEILTKVKCPYCQRARVIKNGKKPNGKQNFYCKYCKQQFIIDYTYSGANFEIKKMIIRLLLNNNGINDIVRISNINASTVLRTLLLLGKSCEINLVKKVYKSVQIEELWLYVGDKKQGSPKSKDSLVLPFR